MPFRRGADFRVAIDGVFLSCTDIRMSAKANSAIVSNTEGKRGNPVSLSQLFTTARIPDIPDGRFQIGCPTFNDDENWFGPEIDLEVGTYHSLTVYPAGIEGLLLYSWDSVLVEDVDHTGRVPGMQPVSVTFLPDGVARLCLTF
jgi:hypothetical protein